MSCHCKQVNDFYQTSNPRVYACGDVIGYPALASTAMEQVNRNKQTNQSQGKDRERERERRLIHACRDVLQELQEVYGYGFGVEFVAECGLGFVFVFK